MDDSLTNKHDDNDETVSKRCSRLGLCEVCAAQDALYTCPKCEVKTCCVRCVQIHKKELSCDGIRDRTKFIPIRKMTKMDFMSDYYFLEECTRYVEDRKHDKIKGITRLNKILPVRLFRLRNAAAERQISLHFLLQNFSRHKQNSTYYDWKQKKIFWNVEWIFVNACGLSCVDKCCPEDTKLCDLLDKYVNPESDPAAMKKSLEYYQSVDLFRWKVYLKAEGLKRSGSRFYLLDIGKTLRENLQKKAIVEFPVIHVSYENNSEMFDIIDSDEDVTSDLEVFKTLLTTQYRDLKRSIDHISNEQEEPKSAKRENNTVLSAKQRKPNAVTESVNLLFTNDSIDDNSTSSDEI